jgi:hypothetical protein
MPHNPVVTLVDDTGNSLAVGGSLPVFTGTPVPLTRDSHATQQKSGTATAPAAGATVAGNVTIPTAGMWEVTVSVFLSGTVAAGDANNVKLVQNAVDVLNPILMPATANAFPQPTVLVVSAAASDTLAVKAIGAGGASAVYSATIVARQVG